MNATTKKASTKKSATSKKTAPKKAAAKKAAPAKSAAQIKAATNVTPEERWHMISVAAYFRAEKRGFVGGDPAEDWAEAEAEIDNMQANKKRALRK